MKFLTLRAGALELQLQPELGGSIARFDWMGVAGREPLLRGTDNAHDTPNVDILKAACFPLVPFSNRIRGGSFHCNGRTITLAPNMPGDASPLHGQGWLAPWSVAHANATEAELVFNHAADEWPWAYEARQHFKLSADTLTLELRCRNLSAEPMPCALAFHPYLPCAADTVFNTQVTSVWTVDATTLPVANVPATGHYDLQQRRICGLGLDNGFEGWSGRANITWPSRGLALELQSDDARRFQLYSPSTGGVFVAEPVQNANAALNEPEARWSELGIVLLALGEERTMSARLICTVHP